MSKPYLELVEMRDDLPIPSEAAGAPPTDLRTEWREAFAKSSCTPAALAELKVPAREPIIGDWFKECDLGFVFGPRGLGKTWLSLFMARKASEGGTMADWTVHRPRRVLYVDGEMALDGIRQRDTALTNAETDGFFYLQHEALFHLTGKVLNLTHPSIQVALLQHCLEQRIEVLFLDNLSCLFTGVKENDADSWEMVLPWLLELRRIRIAVVFVAHAGRNGHMRGTSRREDAANWIVQLTEAQDGGDVKEGARFVARFAKNRNATDETCPPLEWGFNLPAGENHARVSWKKISTQQLFRQWIEDGLTRATEIAEEMNISKGQVSKMAKRGITAGWLRKDGHDYVLTGQA
jgi:hypothetical protein